MTNSATLGSFGDASNAPLVFRNKIINGGFDIWQRGTSQTSAGYGSDDRWNNSHAGSSKTASQQTFTIGQTDVPNNPRYWARTVVTSVAGASNYVLKQQPVENVATLSGQTATLSFWAKADASKNIAVEFVQQFGTGGSPSAAVSGIGVTTCALTTTWKYFTVTASIPSISGKTLGTNNDNSLAVNFWFDAGSSFNARTNSLGQQSGTFDIAQVQLEAGLSATPFEQRPIGMELSLCQRYFEKTFPLETAPANNLGSGIGEVFFSSPTAGGGFTNNMYFSYVFKVTKRGTTTVTWYNTRSATAGTLSTYDATVRADSTPVVDSTTTNCVNAYVQRGTLAVGALTAVSEL